MLDLNIDIATKTNKENKINDNKYCYNTSWLLINFIHFAYLELLRIADQPIRNQNRLLPA